jgi:1-acyl-sn-glycerol-3-phosphate acyltransferase
MQEIIIEKPYKFVPPHRGKAWPWIFQHFRIAQWYLNRFMGVASYQLRGVDHLRESLRLGHGVMLTPNHPRYSDPMAMGWVAREAGTHLYTMASWHLFEQHWLQHWAMRRMGGFSVYREGVDRQSIDTAIEMLASADRPLVVFPEGAVFRTNDHLHALLDGVAFMARTAAKKRAKETPSAKVVIHPVAIKYLFHGDLHKSIEPVLNWVERRLTWESPSHGSSLQRITRILNGLLSLKEIEHMGQAQTGDFATRQQRLIDHLLNPIELRWIGLHQTGSIIPRIKAIRMKIMPELVRGELSSVERQQRWKDLSALYLSQQIASYPPAYLATPTTETRVLEMVERIEEDLIDKARIHRPLEAIIEVGSAIEVSTERGPRGEEDPIMTTLRDNLQSMLNRLAKEAKPFEDS